MIAAAGYATSVWPYASTALLVLLGGVGTWLAAIWWTGRIIHRPPRLTPPRAMMRLGRATPEDLGMAFEERTWEVEDVLRPGEHVRLAGWVIQPEPRQAQRPPDMVLLLHGYGDSRAGALPWAKVWSGLGCRVVSIDLRAHGESGGAASDGGVAERADVSRLIDALRLERPDMRLIVAGISFGAMVAAAVAARRDDVVGLVLDSPIDTWQRATRRWGRLFSLPPPGDLAHRLRLRWSCPSALSDGRLDTRRDVAAAGVPTLLILPRHDVLLPNEAAEVLSAAPAATVWRPDVGHNEAISLRPADYAERAENWLAELPEPDRSSHG